MYKILTFLLFSKFVSGYDFYKKCNFKRIHINEPKIFENMDKDDIIAMSKRYNIPYEKRNIWMVKKIYINFMKNKKIYVIDITIPFAKLESEYK